MVVTPDQLMQRPARELALLNLALYSGFEDTCLAVLKRAVVEIDNGELDIGIPANVIMEAINHVEHDDCDVFMHMVHRVVMRLAREQGGAN